MEEETVQTERAKPVRVGVEPGRSLTLSNVGTLDDIMGRQAAAEYIANNTPNRIVGEEALRRLGEHATLGFAQSL